jgi:hypothetical protein
MSLPDIGRPIHACCHAADCTARRRYLKGDIPKGSTIKTIPHERMKNNTRLNRASGSILRMPGSEVACP